MTYELVTAIGNAVIMWTER